MKKIPLTKGEFALVDDEDFEYLNQWKWYSSRGYATRDQWIKLEKGHTRQNVLMHRLLMGIVGKPGTIDHIDRNPNNNQKSNLRFCTASQNNGNQSISSRNSSGYKGVSWCSTANMWRVRISKKTIARFHDINEAAKCYNRAAEAQFGEFANLNKLKEK